MSLRSLLRSLVGRTLFGMIVLAVAFGPALPAAQGTTAPNEFVRYTLDVSEVTSRYRDRERTGILALGHNQAVAFRLDLSATYRKVRELGRNSVLIAQTKSSCAIDGIRFWMNHHHSFIANIDAFGIQPKDTASIRSLTLEMPYRNSIRPGTFCLGFRTGRYGWIVILTPLTPVRNEAQRIDLGHVEIYADDVDIVGILFDSGAAIKSISFEAQKARER